MSDDLIERLNEFMGEYGDAKDECISQAVDALTAAQARIAELEKALVRIDEASNHYALTTTYSEGTLRYAHQSTRNIAREALKTKGGE